MKKNILITSAFFLGLILLGINISGFFIPLKNPDIYQEEKTGFENDTTLTPKETFILLDSLERNNTKSFVTSANDIFNRSIAHYWENDTIDNKYGIAIPFSENWILASFRFIIPSIYERYEYCNYKKTIERGVGICSQHAIALVDFLNENKVESLIVNLNGHIVTTVNVDDTWWILDPDFGVIIPHDLESIEKNPEIVRGYYSDKQYRDNSITTDKIVDLYEKKGKLIYPNSIIGNVGYIDCNWKKILIERASHILKWIIPILLIIPFICSVIRKYHA